MHELDPVQKLVLPQVATAFMGQVLLGQWPLVALAVITWPME